MEMGTANAGAEIIVQTECYFTHRNNKANCLTNHFAVFDKTSLNTIENAAVYFDCTGSNIHCSVFKALVGAVIGSIQT